MFYNILYEVVATCFDLLNLTSTRKGGTPVAQHPIVHIEIPATDPAAGAKFYADLFGWNLQTDPNFDYHMFQAEGGPGGGFVKAGASEGPIQYKPDSVFIYIATDDIDATLARVESLGGKTLVPRTEIPQTGWFAF